MAIERDKTKPIFEDFIIEKTGDWVLWLLVKGDPCGKLYFRLEKENDPTPGETFEIGFDAYKQAVINTSGWGRLGAQRPDLATWFRQVMADGFPRCDDCNRRWKEAGCS